MFFDVCLGFPKVSLCNTPEASQRFYSFLPKIKVVFRKLDFVVRRLRGRVELAAWNAAPSRTVA